MHGQILTRLDALGKRWDDHIDENTAFKQDVLERLDNIEHGVNGRGKFDRYRPEVLVLELLGKL